MNKVNLVVIERAIDLSFDLENLQIITAEDYLTNEKYRELKSAQIYNLCHTMSYQGIGYYVSLLALARKHKVIPDPISIQDMKNIGLVKLFSQELQNIIQKKLKKIKSDHFILSIYFGQNITPSYNDLTKKIFNLVKSPLLRVEFEKDEGLWSIKSIRVTSLKDLPPHHKDFFHEAAMQYFSGRFSQKKEAKKYLYDLAILHNPHEEYPPSDERALKKFIKAGQKLGIYVELITKEDSSRLLEFDALFIRETTQVHHHTYRMARKAEAEGLIVIDDPESILKCSNKVFLEELLQKHQINRPKTAIIHEDNFLDILKDFSFPIVVKSPDSAFSRGVHKLKNKEDYTKLVEELFRKSDLLIIQEFLPTDYDWRIGVLNKEIIFACKYYMASGHWQIYDGASGSDGEHDTVSLDEVPSKVKSMALKATKIIGHGLYGVDIKQNKDGIYLIEINDNPNIDHGVEDSVLGDSLYQKVMQHFLNKLNEQRQVDPIE